MRSREFGKLSSDNKAILEGNLLDFPVRIGQIARELGVAIKVSSMRTGVSGQIMREHNRYTIRVNRNEARERQRFTIAHELAHFLLHRSIIDSSPDGITDNVLYRSGNPERIEFEANRLAADIVMPMNLVSNQLNTKYAGVISQAAIESLAADFQVSKVAMEIRLSTYAEVA